MPKPGRPLTFHYQGIAWMSWDWLRIDLLDLTGDLTATSLLSNSPA